jgi:hypothetical protein
MVLPRAVTKRILARSKESSPRRPPTSLLGFPMQRALFVFALVPVVLSCSDGGGPTPTATHLVVTIVPSGAVAGSNFTVQPVVEARDANELLVATFDDSISVSATLGAGTLGGQKKVKAVGGVATFSELNLSAAGGYTLEFTAPGLTAATAAVTVTPNPLQATQLAITTPPSGAEAGASFTIQPVVEARNFANQLVASFTDSVSVSAVGPGTLDGVKKVKATGGVATFAGLSLSAAGNYAMSFSATGLTAATVDITATPAAPTPLKAVTFDSYTSTSQLLTDCTTFYCVEDHITDVNGDVTLDATSAPPGATKSMRYRYKHPGDGCNSITLGRAVRFAPVLQEAWAEFTIRWSTSFTVANATCAPNDHKLIFGDTQGAQSGRWALYVGNGSPPTFAIKVERPSPTGGTGPYNRNTNLAKTAESLWDGNWHTVRLYLRSSTTTTSADGRLKLWIDGVILHDETGFNTVRPVAEGSVVDRIEGFSFAHNKDDGPPGVDMFIWWGPMKFFSQNPGW